MGYSFSLVPQCSRMPYFTPVSFDAATTCSMVNVLRWTW